MKHLIFAVLLLAACSKQNLTTYETKEVFYKLQEVDKDGKTTDTPTRSTTVTYQTKNEDEGNGGEHHDEDDEDDDNDYPCPIDLKTFVITKLSPNTVKIYWEALDEDNVSHYNILKSFDSMNWNDTIKVEKKLGVYEYIDKF